MSRKQRLFIGLARQLVGIQAPPAGTKPASASESERGSREPSPGQTSHRERAQARQAQRDEYLAAKEAEEILKKGEKEAEMAAKGAYSEKPLAEDPDNTQEYRTDTPEHARVRELSNQPSFSSLKSDESITPLQKRASWNHPSDMSAAELAEANARLMARLRHFLAIPMANTPISVFFYNNEISKQRTIYTNPSGHFSISAALDFVPTHVRILASDKLSATEQVIVTDSSGISVISDIDDTIKHSAISSGAREIFRNAFIRDLSDLTIDGVREWYNRMAELGVKFHYVSNSPWQLYPVIAKYFSLAGLPNGSFHLKQYSGMLQGIFEPVAERKKSTLDKIARDFPERRFILIGDSGEADLEVYTDFVLENPGRVAAVFIRDVTTPEGAGFFDPSVGSMPGDRSSSPPQRESGRSSNRFQASSEEDDPEFKAAIAASLRDLEAEEKRRSKSAFPVVDEDHPDFRPNLPARKTQPPPSAPPVENLIDLSSDDEPESHPALRRVNTDTPAGTKNHRASVSSFSSVKTAPPPPRKPMALRSSSGDSRPQPLSPKPPPPPKPRQTTSNVQNAGRPSQAPTSTPSRPPVAPKPRLQSEQSYAGMARDKLASVYNNLPSATGYLNSHDQQENEPSERDVGSRKAPPPPPPPRRGVVAYPMAAASYVGTKATSAWQNAPPIPHRSTRPNAQSQAQPYTTSSPREGLNRTNTSSTIGSTLGMNGGNGGGGGVYNKREDMWRQRWARAEQIMGEQGVLLRSWRVGTDVVGEAERLIKKDDRERRSGNENENGNRNGSGKGR
jgi:phosphatidate phosphatase APP1